MPDPADFGAYDAWRNSGGTLSTEEATADSEEAPPATGEEDQSLSDAEAELAAAGGEGEEPAEGESEEATDETGEESETAQQPQQQGKGSKGLEKRFRKLNNRLAELHRDNQELRAQLGQVVTEEDDSEPEAEQAAVEAAAAVDPEAPQLSKFDTLEEWQAAYSKYVDKLVESKVTAAKTEARQEKEAEIAKARGEAAQADWDRNASRFANFNEVVTDDVKTSHAMVVAMKLDPEAGTRIAYYLGQHPDEALAIAERTLARNEAEWGPAVTRAGLELGRILAKLDGAPGKGVPQKKTPTPAAKTATQKAGAVAVPPPVSKANRPPALMKGQAVRPGPQSSADVDPSDFRKWEAAREREIAAAKSGRK
jgi:hypothetical protein